MALEASDMGDSTILDQTKQYENGNGQIQFKITLPSGRELESEWLKPDMKKKAMVAWLDVVKAEAVADSDAARAEAREAAMKQQRAQRDALQEPVLTQVAASTGGTTAQASSVIQSARSAVAPTVSAVNSPDSFVEQGIQAAQADYDHWNEVALDALNRVRAARNNVQKWQNIYTAMSGQGANTGNGRSQAGSNQDNSESDAVGTSNSRRRRKRRTTVSAVAASECRDVCASDPGV